MNRRGFFQTVSAAIAGSAVAPLLPAAPSKIGPPVARPWPPHYPFAHELAESALRMLGLLMPEESATRCEIDLAMERLAELAGRGSLRYGDQLCVSPRRVRELRWALAAELAPTYGVTPERNPLVYAIGAKYGAL